MRVDIPVGLQLLLGTHLLCCCWRGLHWWPCHIFRCLMTWIKLVFTSSWLPTKTSTLSDLSRKIFEYVHIKIDMTLLLSYMLWTLITHTHTHTHIHTHAYTHICMHLHAQVLAQVHNYNYLSFHFQRVVLSLHLARANLLTICQTSSGWRMTVYYKWPVEMNIQLWWQVRH